MAQTDIALLAQWVTSRDADAFAELVSRHAGMVYGTCHRVLGNADESEDVAQECFIELARSGGKVRQCLGGWLHAMAVHRSLNRLKTERRLHDREQRYAQERAQTVDGGWDDLREHIDAAIAELPENLREPIVHRFLEGRTHEAIALQLNVPKSTVRFHIQQGTEAIRRTLERRGVRVVAPGVLASLLITHMAEAAPASLTAKLGALALAGGNAGASAELAAHVGGLVVKKKTYVSIATLVAIVLLSLSPVGTWVVGRFSVADTGLSGKVQKVESGTGASAAGKSPPKPAAKAGVVVGGGSSAETEGSDPEEPQEATPEQDASISGRVITEDGYPFSGATVHLRLAADVWGFEPLLDREVSTDADGLYAAKGIRQAGTAWVYASAKGHATQKSRPLSLVSGAVYDRVDFTLPKGRYFVSGTVVGAPHNDPVAGATIQLRHYAYSETDGSGSCSTVASDFSMAYSDADGWFEIAIDIEGLCDFVVRKEGYGPGFFSGIATGTQDAEFVLKAPGGIAGKVTAKDGTSLAGVRIRATAKGWPNNANSQSITAVAPTQLPAVEAVTGEDGGYEMGGLGADYLYAVQVAGVREESSQPSGIGSPSDITSVLATMITVPSLAQVLRVQIKPGEVIQGIDFVLDPVSTLRGRVTDSATGKPVYPFGVFALLANSGALDSPEANLKGWAGTKPDGTYELQLAHAQTLSLEFYGAYTFPGGVYFQSGTPPATTVEIPPGGTKTVDLKFDSPVTVPLRAVDAAGKPQAELMVTMGEAEGSSRWGGVQATDADGRVRWDGIPPLIPFVFQVNDLSRQGPSQVRGQSEPFVGQPGETLSELVIVCEDKGGIEGVAVDGAGNPLPATVLHITATSGDGRTQTLSPNTDDSGHFVVLWALPEGAYSTLAFESDDMRARVDGITIAGDRITNVGRIVLQPAPAVPKRGN